MRLCCCESQERLAHRLRFVPLENLEQTKMWKCDPKRSRDAGLLTQSRLSIDRIRRRCGQTQYQRTQIGRGGMFAWFASTPQCKRHRKHAHKGAGVAPRHIRLWWTCSKGLNICNTAVARLGPLSPVHTLDVFFGVCGWACLSRKLGSNKAG